MGFQKLTERQKSGSTSLPASVSIAGKERPRVIISLLSDFCQQLGPGWEKCDAFVGDGDDTGKIMLQCSPGGVFEVRQLRGSGKTIDIGFVPSIAEVAQGKRRTNAVLKSPLCVVVDLPDFSEEASEADGADSEADADGEVAAESNVERAPSDIQQPPLPKQAGGELISGILICATGPLATVTFNGKTAHITSRQAELVAILARPRPNPVVVSFISDKLWAGSPPSQAESTIKVIGNDVNPLIKPLGLAIRSVPGIGYQLVKL